MEEVLILAIAFNFILRAIGWYRGTRQVVIISSVIWILIGFNVYTTYNDLMLLVMSYLIAFAQIFIPLNSKRLVGGDSGREC